MRALFYVTAFAGLVTIGCLLLAASCRGDCPPPKKAVQYRPVYHDKKIIIADAAFFVFDYNAKDVFLFAGPPPAVYPGLTLGVNSSGTEVKGVPTPAQNGPSSGIKLLAEDDQSSDRAFAPRVKSPESAALSSLSNSCSQCHTGSSGKGGVSLFAQNGRLSGNIDWKLVKEVIDSGRMPPRTSGKPPVSVSDRQEIAKLAK